MTSSARAVARPSATPAQHLVERGPRGATAAGLTLVPRRRRRAPRIPFVTLIGLVLLGGVIGLLLFNTSMQQSSFATTALEEQASTLTAREQTLEVELDELRDPQKVAERAVSLGMVLPPSSAVLHLPSGRVEGAPVPATAQDGVRIAPTPPVRPAALARPPARGRSGDTGSDSSDRGRQGSRTASEERSATPSGGPRERRGDRQDDRRSEQNPSRNR